jgi:hypothetical protein
VTVGIIWNGRRLADGLRLVSVKRIDLQLKQFGITRVIIIHDRQYLHRGDRPICRRARLLRHPGATAALSQEAMHAAHRINGPTFADAILTTNELIAQLSG